MSIKITHYSIVTARNKAHNLMTVTLNHMPQLRRQFIKLIRKICPLVSESTASILAGDSLQLFIAIRRVLIGANQRSD